MPDVEKAYAVLLHGLSCCVQFEFLKERQKRIGEAACVSAS